MHLTSRSPALGTGLLLALALAGCGRVPERAAANGETADARVTGNSAPRITFPPDSPKLAQIRTALVGAAEVPQDEVVAPGRVQINPNRISRVSLPTPGRIASVEVRLGDSVTQGQLLLRIESPEAETAISDCLHADAGLTRAQAEHAKAQADFERISDLHQHGAAAKKDLISAQAELARAESALKDALAASQQIRRRLSILGLKPCEFGQPVAVRAPISGKVLEINVVPGEYRNDTSAPLVTIADLSTVWVTSDIPESSIRWIRQGERMRIELAAYPGEVFHGRVSRVADTVNPQTRSVEVQTELDNSSGRFRPEMFARIRHSHQVRVVPAVPYSALVRSRGLTWVFVQLAPGEFQRVPVETGEPFGSLVPVFSGIQPGARVVVEGAILLQGNGGGS